MRLRSLALAPSASENRGRKVIYRFESVYACHRSLTLLRTILTAFGMCHSSLCIRTNPSRSANKPTPCSTGFTLHVAPGGRHRINTRPRGSHVQSTHQDTLQSWLFGAQVMIDNLILRFFDSAQSSMFYRKTSVLSIILRYYFPVLPKMPLDG